MFISAPLVLAHLHSGKGLCYLNSILQHEVKEHLDTIGLHLGNKIVHCLLKVRQRGLDISTYPPAKCVECRIQQWWVSESL